jgi:iron complex outermembrane receptor protein
MKLGTLGTEPDLRRHLRRSYEYQTNPSDPYKENVGIYSDGSPVFRWKHNLGAAWKLNNMGARVSLRHLSGYATRTILPRWWAARRSTAMSMPTRWWTCPASYKFNKATSLTVGIKNLFDKDPPFSNQSTPLAAWL